ncbi:MAG TPA: hypothetical protein VGM62_16175 [Chthoniobacterales bacterium]
MKTYKWITIALAMAAACVLLPGATTSYAEHGFTTGGTLVITRAPDLGNNVFVDVRIDGRKAGGILWAHSYQRAISPGTHVITVKLGPAQYTYLPSSITLNVHPGRAYYFQAKKQGGALVLGRW